MEAKLAPPRLGRSVLPRRALVRRLLAASDARLALLIAPAGYGKTTTLALWRSRESRPVAWVTADPADVDAVRLLTHVMVAIDRAIGLGADQLSHVQGSGVSATRTLVPLLTSALHEAQRPLVVMLDDIHHVAGTEAVDALRMLVRYVPGGVTIVLAARQDIGLPLARLRANGAVIEVSAADLALDPTESARLAAMQGNDLAADDARELHTRTKGWPALVYLASRGALSTAPDTRSRPAAVTGRDRVIAEYFDAELLNRATSDEVEFLVRTSVLDRLTGDLCDAVAGRSGSDALLRRLAGTNHLVAALDTVGGWYECHPLLRGHLAGLLVRRSGATAQAHRRAATWYAAHGMRDTAIDHLFAAGEPGAAAAQLTAIILRTFRAGREATVERWLDRLGDAGLRRQPYLAAAAAWIHCVHGDQRAASRMADLMEVADYGRRRPPAAWAFEAVRASIRALMARNGLTAAIAEAEWASAAHPPDGEWQPVLSATLGTILAVAGQADRADGILREAVATSGEAGAGRAMIAAQAWRVMLAMERDDWAAARALIAEQSAFPVESRRSPDVTLVPAAAVAARVALYVGDVDEARRRMAEFQAARSTVGLAAPWLSVRSLLEAARAYLGLADFGGARSVLRQAEDIIRWRPDLGRLPAEVAALRAQVRKLPPGPGRASTLTPAEIRVLHLLPTYLSAPEIAERLFVTPNTVKTQIQALYGKLGATSRGEAVERAVEVGLLEPLPMLAETRITRS